MNNTPDPNMTNAASALAALLNGSVTTNQVRQVDDDPEIDPAILRAANERHDKENGGLNNFIARRIRSGWKR